MPTNPAMAWSAAVGGLRLGASSDGATVTVALENVGDRRLEVLSEVQGIEVNLDWYRFTLTDASGHERTLRIVSDRNRSAIIKAQVDPGKRVEHVVDLAAWAKRPGNGAAELAGDYDLVVGYEVSDAGTWWTGRLETPRLRVRVTR